VLLFFSSTFMVLRPSREPSGHRLSNKGRDRQTFTVARHTSAGPGGAVRLTTHRHMYVPGASAPGWRGWGGYRHGSLGYTIERIDWAVVGRRAVDVATKSGGERCSARSHRGAVAGVGLCRDRCRPGGLRPKRPLQVMVCAGRDSAESNKVDSTIRRQPWPELYRKSPIEPAHGVRTSDTIVVRSMKEMAQPS